MARLSVGVNDGEWHSVDWSRNTTHLLLTLDGGAVSASGEISGEDFVITDPAIFYVGGFPSQPPQGKNMSSHL